MGAVRGPAGRCADTERGEAAVAGLETGHRPPEHNNTGQREMSLMKLISQ